MKRLFFLLTAIVGLLAINAQNTNKQSIINRINAIKNQTDIYLWDQFTHTNPDTAKVGSAKRLILHVETELGGNEEVSLDEVLRFAEFLKIDRGNLKQYFAYITKENAHKIKSSATLDPTMTLVDPPFGGQKPIKEMPDTVKRKFIADAFTKRIYEVKTFSNVYKLLKSMQANGQILQFGKLRDVEDYSSFDLILFDMKSQDIVTLLSAENGNGTRTNMLDGSPDSLDNYPKDMTAVIWYIKN